MLLPNVLIRHIIFNYTDIYTIKSCILNGISFDGYQMTILKSFYEYKNKSTTYLDNILSHIENPKKYICTEIKLNNHLGFWNLCLTGNIDYIKWSINMGFDIHFMNDIPLLICYEYKHKDLLKYLMVLDDKQNYNKDAILNYIEVDYLEKIDIYIHVLNYFAHKIECNIDPKYNPPCTPSDHQNCDSHIYPFALNPAAL